MAEKKYTELSKLEKKIIRFRLINKINASSCAVQSLAKDFPSIHSKEIEGAIKSLVENGYFQLKNNGKTDAISFTEDGRHKSYSHLKLEINIRKYGSRFKKYFVYLFEKIVVPVLVAAIVAILVYKYQLGKPDIKTKSTTKPILTDSLLPEKKPTQGIR